MRTAFHKPAKTVGAYEAKTKLSELLDQVERGQEIVITRHARSVARLVPNAKWVADKAVFARIRTLHSKLSLPKGETAKALIEAGRRI